MKEKTANTADVAKVLVTKFPEIAIPAMTNLIHGVFEVIVEIAGTNKKGVNIKGIGIFKFKETKERSGRNPGTGESVLIPASRKLVFKKSKQL